MKPSNNPIVATCFYRDAVYRILVTVLNRQLTPMQFNRLLDRLGFKEARAVISFQVSVVKNLPGKKARIYRILSLYEYLYLV